MVIRVVVEEEKMVNSVANLNISVSNLFVNIMDMLMADITHGVVNNRLPTQKLALVSSLCHSRPIFPLLFSTKSRSRKKLSRRTKGGYLIPFSHILDFLFLHKVLWYLKQARYRWRSANGLFHTLDIIKYVSYFR